MVEVVSSNINIVTFYFPCYPAFDDFTCDKYGKLVPFIEVVKNEIRYCLKKDGSKFYIKILDIGITYTKRGNKYDINFTIQYIDNKNIIKMRCFELIQLLYNTKTYNRFPYIMCYFLIPTINFTTKRKLVSIEPHELGNTLYDIPTKKKYQSDKYFDWIFFTLQDAKEGAAKLFPDRLPFRDYNIGSNYYK